MTSSRRYTRLTVHLRHQRYFRKGLCSEVTALHTNFREADFLLNFRLKSVLIATPRLLPVKKSATLPLQLPQLFHLLPMDSYASGESENVIKPQS